MKFSSGFVSLIGKPNVGKSTLLNILTGQKVAITSNKPQTTRNSIRSIITDSESQIIFVDTPGIHEPKTKLGQFMVKEAVNSIGDVDIVLFLVDVSDKNCKFNNMPLVEKLKNLNKPVFLILNKIDTVTKETIIPIISHFSNLVEFKQIIPISALKKDGTNIVLEEIKKLLPEGPMFFPSDSLTDQPERVIVSEIIREKILTYLNDEVPHGVGVDILTFKERPDKDIIDINATIFCEKKSHKSIIIGKQGQMLKRIGSKSRIEVENFLDSKVFLDLWVKVKDDWRNENTMLKDLGYR
jgi:GTP-binding protein Era